MGDLGGSLLPDTLFSCLSGWIRFGDVFCTTLILASGVFMFIMLKVEVSPCIILTFLRCLPTHLTFFGLTCLVLLDARVMIDLTFEI